MIHPIPCPPGLAAKPIKKGLKPKQVAAFFQSKGYAPKGIGGYLYKEFALGHEGHKVRKRVRITSHAVRREAEVHIPSTPYNKAHTIWVRERSGYLKNLWLDGDKIGGLKREGC